MASDDRVTPLPVQALLFDLGGVMIDIDFERVFAHWASLPGADLERARPHFAADETYHRYERGEIDDAGFFAHVRRVLGTSADDAQLLDGWNRVFVGQNERALQLVRQAADRCPSYAFTNTSASHQATWSRAYPDVVTAFRQVFSSAEIGLRKPDRAAFEHVVEQIGFAPGTILFFDDLSSNVAGARAAGLQAVQVSGPDDIAGALSRLGLV